MPEFVCPPGFCDRLDRALASLGVDVSRTHARRLIDAGSVFIDGRRCRVASRLVRAGDRIRFAAAKQAGMAPLPDLHILYEDEGMIAVDKPAGMPSTPTRAAAAGTALDVLRRQLGRMDPERATLHPVHRLDAGTSGVLLFAKRPDVAGALGAMFAEGRVRKHYSAVVGESPQASSGRIATPLLRVAGQAIVSDAGKPATTEWRRAGTTVAGAVLAVTPLSGRMHQIRAHLAHIGHPVVGDRRYGGPSADRLLLHATRLEFAIGEPAKKIVIASQPPWDATSDTRPEGENSDANGND